ncbi:MAG TPA: alpha/beta hydrolase [Micromonosporaceae bacterium]
MADAVIVPGRLYGPNAPLLMYSGDVAERRGAAIHRHTWSAEPPDFTKPGIEDWVCGEVAPMLERIEGSPLLIGKSLGTNAARLAAQHRLPAIWLTPVLRFMPWVVEALRSTTAPFLLVGGTADRSWDADLARELTPHVLSVDGADHGMYIPGPLRGSIEVLAQVVDAVEVFLDDIGWRR